jgi:hypothetical protein
MSLMQSLQAKPPIVYAAPEASMSMPTTFMRPPSSSHAMYISEHVYPAPALVVLPSSQVAATPEPSLHTIREEERSACDTAEADKSVVNEDNAPIGDGDERMRGSQNATDKEQPYICRYPRVASDWRHLGGGGG